MSAKRPTGTYRETMGTRPEEIADTKAMIIWTAENQLPGESDAVRAAWTMGSLIIRLKQRFPRAHLSQLVAGAFNIVKASESLREMEKKERGEVGLHH